MPASCPRETSYQPESSKVTGDVHTEVSLGDKGIFPEKLIVRVTGYKPEYLEDVSPYQELRGKDAALGGGRES